jgi:hypothetical protein
MDFWRESSPDVFCEINRFASSIDFLCSKGFPDVFCELGPLADEAIDFSSGKRFFMDLVSEAP